jgi:hypothetical protein
LSQTHPSGDPQPLVAANIQRPPAQKSIASEVVTLTPIRTDYDVEVSSVPDQIDCQLLRHWPGQRIVFLEKLKANGLLGVNCIQRSPEVLWAS